MVRPYTDAMIDRHALLKSTLKQGRRSITRTRAGIYDAIEQRHQVSLAELVRYPHGANRASVYRTIDLFEKLNIIQRFQKGKESIVELTGNFADHHHHLSCTGCSATVAIPGSSAIEASLHAAAQAAGFVVQAHIIEVQGLCAACRQI